METRLVEVKRKAAFLKAMIDYLSDGAQLSLEGNLSEFRAELGEIPGVGWGETAELRRQTLTPQLDFVVLPLGPETTERILRRIVPRIGVVRQVVHIQIAQDGALQFAAYDNFALDCVLVGPAVTDEFLQGLVEQGLARDFEPKPPSRRDFGAGIV